AAGGQYRGTTSRELSGWLWTIARNVLTDELRRSYGARTRDERMPSLRRALTDREIERVEELAGLEQLREAVAQRLSELPAEEREAVRLRIIEDRSYAEVARAMNTNGATARARVSRGLRALSISLRDDHTTWRGA